MTRHYLVHIEQMNQIAIIIITITVIQNGATDELQCDSNENIMEKSAVKLCLYRVDFTKNSKPD